MVLSKIIMIAAGVYGIRMFCGLRKRAAEAGNAPIATMAGFGVLTGGILVVAGVAALLMRA